MRVWLQKQKKKEEAKAAAQAATPPVEVTPAAPEVLPVGDGTEQPVDSIEDAHKAEGGAAEQAAGSAEAPEEAGQRAGSAAAQPKEVGCECLSFHSLASMRVLYNQKKKKKPSRRDIVGPLSIAKHGCHTCQ
jgi:hypothetical protein